MRKTILIAATLAALPLTSVFTSVDARADGAWCAYYSHGGGTNCGFHTYGQCLAAVSGVGGSCSPNPYLSSGPRRPRF